MIEWVVTDDGLRVIDHADVELEVRADDWQRQAGEVDTARPVDEAVAGSATELRLPSAFVQVTDRTSEYSREFGSETGPVELDEGKYLLDLGTAIKTYLQFEGAATLRKTSDFDTLVVSFPERTRVVLGFRSRHERPIGTITVPSTPAGIATALSHLHSSLKVTSPDRSFPTMRGHPPRVETGDAVGIPDTVADATADTGIRVRAPPELEHLYVLAPLAHYLQAEVTADAGDRAVLEAPGAGVERRLPGLPELQAETAALLRKVFYLDCLVRNVGPYGTDLAEAKLLEDLPLDPARAYEATPAERLASYLSVPHEALDSNVPEWHLATYVQPVAARARSLPYLLQKLSLVYLPETSELDGAELIERSLDDFYRGNLPSRPEQPAVGPGRLPVQGDRGPGESVGYRKGEPVASVDVVKPELGAARVHGWLAEGVPIDVFKATHSAFENRLDYLGRGGDGIQVAVVLNDEGMAGEHDEAASIYRERAEDLPIEVTVHEYLDREELAAVFEAEHDFVHYIGHCEESGLRCPDGNLSATEIDECNAQTFFLNACGSYHEGMILVEKGSVVGGITFKKVLDKQAATVGTTFAQLLMHGFSFDRAMRLARRRVMTGKDYAVVGDGTHALTQSESLAPLETKIEKLGGDDYQLTADMYSCAKTGGIYQVYSGDSEGGSHLCGNRSQYRFDRESLVSYLRGTSEPVLYDGQFYWSTELVEELMTY